MEEEITFITRVLVVGQVVAEVVSFSTTRIEFFVYLSTHGPRIFNGTPNATFSQ